MLICGSPCRTYCPFTCKTVKMDERIKGILFPICQQCHGDIRCKSEKAGKNGAGSCPHSSQGAAAGRTAQSQYQGETVFLCFSENAVQSRRSLESGGSGLVGKSRLDREEKTVEQIIAGVLDLQAAIKIKLFLGYAQLSKDEM